MSELGGLWSTANAIRAEFSALDVDDGRHCLRTARADLLAWRRNRPPWQLYHRSAVSQRVEPMALLARGVDVEEDAILTALDQLQELVEAERIGEARRLVSSLSPDESKDPRIKAWVDVLALPKAVPTKARDVDRTADYAFLERESAHHRGHWMAVAEGALVTSASTYEELVAHLQDHRGSVPLVTFIPESPERHADAR